MRRLLKEMEAKGIDGLALDLRRNHVRADAETGADVKLRQRKRRRVEKSLSEAATDIHKQVVLSHRLDSLGDHLDTDLLGEPQDRDQ